jgi:putative ABC transport system permease protein
MSMQRRDTLRLALAALSAHKLRTALTLTGLIIGVTSLILVMTLIQGANTYVETKIANLGTDVFQVSRVPLVPVDFDEFTRAYKNRDLTLDDLRAVEQRCDLCMLVGAQADTLGRVRTEAQSMPDVAIRGQTANMGSVSTLDVEQGRFFYEGEARAAAPVVVLGAGVVERLFPSRSPIGKAVRVADEEFTVIGVTERIGAILGQEQDNFVIIPLDAYRKIFGLRRSLIFHVRVFAASGRLDAAQDEVRQILRGRRHSAPGARDEFYFATAETYMALWRNISSVFFVVFVLISSVASIVGGIVIMNITLVSVTERTKEIGLRRSVGATQRDIAGQFLLEVLAQCLVGGLTGVLLGFGLALLLRQFTPFPAHVQLWVAGLGLALASVIAIIFGVYPAMRAARLDPVVALRTE